MTTAVYIYIAYTIASIAMTVWVARTLHKNGRIFLLDAFKDKEEMADSVNHLLVVGFYLINVGFILLFLRFGTKPETLVEGIEYIATKLGVVLLVLGFMHFFNMFNFNRMRKKGRSHAVVGEMPPVITPVANSKTDEP
tara:strand:- start:550 stop:963 length:414 start_codon:yes stop_codon:yes gene_type:complete